MSKNCTATGACLICRAKTRVQRARESLAAAEKNLDAVLGMREEPPPLLRLGVKEYPFPPSVELDEELRVPLFIGFLVRRHLGDANVVLDMRGSCAKVTPRQILETAAAGLGGLRNVGPKENSFPGGADTPR